MENFLNRRVLTDDLRIEVVVAALTGDAATFIMGVELPGNLEELWFILGERFGEPEDVRLDALTHCT